MSVKGVKTGTSCYSIIIGILLCFADSRALYEDDLLGLNILSPSAEMQTRDISKPQKATSINTKKVWQHGGVTIPLSQGSKAELSVAAKSVLEQFEDLTFMTSSVLMFPLKSD